MSIYTFLLILGLVLSAVVILIMFFTTKMTSLQSSLKDELKDEESNKILLEWLKDMKSSVDKNSDALERQLSEQRKSLQTQLKDQTEAMNKRTQLIWKQLENTTQVVTDVHKQLGGINEFGKDMKDLSNILKSPKLRGGLGEQFLYEILANSLPNDLYKTQYKFRNGAIADAVIKTDKGLIPIDSKFPLENFKLMITSETPDERDRAKKTFVKDVKKRIDEISSKYILPEEGTTNFAVMYIPSENVFYELIVNTPEVEDYAKKSNVFLTSPNTLNYQVKGILVAYQQQELQKHAGEILKSLAGIQVEAAKFEQELGVLDGHIDRTTKSMTNVKGKYSRLFGKIESVQALANTDEVLELSESSEEQKEA